MSKQSFDDFVQKLKDDTGLQQELRSRFGSPEQGIPAKDLVEFAAGKGYQFQVEEVQGELSDNQLDAVSGGGKVILNDLVISSVVARKVPFNDV